jgi:hypothetical protein
MDARRATKVVARLRPVSPRPACGSSRTSSVPCYRTQPSAPLPAPRCARPSSGRTTKPRRARAASHLRSCAAERAVARRIVIARTSARLRGRTYRTPRFGEHAADAAFCRNPKGRGLPRHGQRSLGCGSGSMSAPFYNVSCGSLRPFPLHAARVRVRGARSHGFVVRRLFGLHQTALLTPRPAPGLHTVATV